MTVALPREAHLLALDERGEALSSLRWAETLTRARDSGCPEFVVAIGGPDGLADSVRLRANSVVSFGAATWPHQLVRALAAEQIYRALSILSGHPYHRE